ncbi:MAG: hypothetical protein C4K60_11865 [Ideonella sp. MAG2]|nr:MAG: hypothetical protein C4K60_11865 [Ideonella sp. MAG2]
MKNPHDAFNAGRDVYIDYPYESVMFRWEHLTQRVYKKFYGQVESANPVPHDNRLYNDAILCGDEIDAAAYLQGKEEE